VRVGLVDHGGFKKLSRSSKVNSRRFKSLYGCRPEVCAAIWFDLTHPSTEGDPQLDPTSFGPMHFLMGIRFLKLYETESVLLGAFKQELESEKAVREVVRKIVNAIQALKAKKVRDERFLSLLFFLLLMPCLHFLSKNLYLDSVGKWRSKRSLCQVFHVSGWHPLPSRRANRV
jgi:hypothetical protein